LQVVEKVFKVIYSNLNTFYFPFTLMWKQISKLPPQRYI